MGIRTGRLKHCAHEGIGSLRIFLINDSPIELPTVWQPNISGVRCIAIVAQTGFELIIHWFTNKPVTLRYGLHPTHFCTSELSNLLGEAAIAAGKKPFNA
ncbi:hypothetical protein [Methyloglobulus sp.]|uniref:hypothetical protein n=1 Tax=Methyloglobulus sp. TaxID=2518622 RepID=UPI003988E084